MRLVNQVIVTRLDSPVHLIPQLAGHLVSAGGKRVRPMLTLLAAKLCGYRGQRHVTLAAAVEFIHTATLLHDDVVDASDLRRGLATANTIWGNKPSVLVGDFLFSRAFQLMVEDGSLAVLAILSNASAVIAEGEVAQLMTANDTTTTEADYLDVIVGKTATLFAAAAEIGALVADRPEAEALALRRYGESIGIAFQLIDDILDYSAARGDAGQEPGRRFSRRQDHPAGGAGVRARQRRGAPFLAAHAGGARAAGRRSGARGRADGATWRPGRQPGARRPLCRGRARRPGLLSRIRRRGPPCTIWSISASSALTDVFAEFRHRRRIAPGRRSGYRTTHGSECSWPKAWRAPPTMPPAPAPRWAAFPTCRPRPRCSIWSISASSAPIDVSAIPLRRWIAPERRSGYKRRHGSECSSAW